MLVCFHNFSDVLIDPLERMIVRDTIRDCGQDFVGETLQTFIRSFVPPEVYPKEYDWCGLLDHKIVARPVIHTFIATREYDISIGVESKAFDRDRIGFDMLNIHKRIGNIKEESNMPPKTNLFEYTHHGPVLCKVSAQSNIPPIKKVEFFTDGLPTIKITFIDGTHTEATCHENDHFSFEVGLGICIAKRAMGKDFNKTIRKAVKIYDRRQKELIAIKAAAAKAKMEHKKFLERRAKAKQRREERRIQQEIYIQTQALIAAQKAVEGEPEKEG